MLGCSGLSIFRKFHKPLGTSALPSCGRCDICWACQSICPFIPTDSGVPRTVDPQKSLKSKTVHSCVSVGAAHSRFHRLQEVHQVCDCFVCWLLIVPATCECISGTDLQRQFYVLPHWDRSCRSNFPSHPVTVYWHQADQSQAPGRVATGVPIFKSLVWLDPEKIPALAGFEPGTSRSRGGRLNH